jgi:hypothetical protein
MKKTIYVALLGSSIGVFATAGDASADCQSACKQDFPDACYNIKDYRWSKDDDGIARVRVKYNGAFPGAFDWALGEINDPHNGMRPKLHLKSVTTNADIKVHDTANLCIGGYCGFWGVAHTYRSGNRTTHANITLAKDELNENTAAKDKNVRKLTILHELLHTVGMNHACVNDNHVMWACGMPNKNYVDVPYMTNCDTKGLVKLYGERKEAAPAASENLLRNASFENKLEDGPWGNWDKAIPGGNDDARREKAAAGGGEFGALVHPKDEDEFTGVFQAINADGGQKYRIDASVRRVSGSADQCLFVQFLSFEGGMPEVLSSKHVAAGTKKTWHDVGFNVTAPAGSQVAAVYAGSCETGSSTYHWDKMRMREVE